MKVQTALEEAETEVLCDNPCCRARELEHVSIQQVPQDWKLMKRIMKEGTDVFVEWIVGHIETQYPHAILSVDAVFRDLEVDVCLDVEIAPSSIVCQIVLCQNETRSHHSNESFKVSLCPEG